MDRNKLPDERFVIERFHPVAAPIRFRSARLILLPACPRSAQARAAAAVTTTVLGPRPDKRSITKSSRADRPDMKRSTVVDPVGSVVISPTPNSAGDFTIWPTRRPSGSRPVAAAGRSCSSCSRSSISRRHGPSSGTSCSTTVTASTPTIRPPTAGSTASEPTGRTAMTFDTPPDLVTDLLQSDADHEFASHSFSHALFGRPETDREFAVAELERSREIAADWNESIDSFVYPRNDIGHREVLAEQGVSAYRGRSPTRDGVRGIFDSTIQGTGRCWSNRPSTSTGWSTCRRRCSSSGSRPARTVAESIWTDPMVELARSGIDEAARTDGLFHMWLHPNNLTHERDDRRMRAILSPRASADRDRSHGRDDGRCCPPCLGIVAGYGAGDGELEVTRRRTAEGFATQERAGGYDDDNKARSRPVLGQMAPTPL